MKIAISTTAPGLDAEVEPRFGRCQYFVIVDTETMEFEAVENTNAMASSGAGISTAQVIVSKGVQAVLTGNCGPNAFGVLDSAGINVITGVSGKVRDAVQDYKSGKYGTSSQPNVSDHFGSGGSGTGAGPGSGIGGGMGRGRGMGGGMGRGRGMGGGMGRGRGMGMGPGMMQQAGPAFQGQSREANIEELKAQSQTLTQQLAEIQRRIDELNKKE